jgi:hypothetical protein
MGPVLRNNSVRTFRNEPTDKPDGSPQHDGASSAASIGVGAIADAKPTTGSDLTTIKAERQLRQT